MMKKNKCRTLIVFVFCFFRVYIILIKCKINQNTDSHKR